MTRRGSMLLESSLAITLVVTAFVGVAQLLAIAAHQRRESRRREVAIAEVGNALEQLVQRPWAELSDEQLASYPLSTVAERELPEGELRIRVNDAEAFTDAKRITVQVSWINRAGMRVKPIELVGWSFAENGREVAP